MTLLEIHILVNSYLRTKGLSLDIPREQFNSLLQLNNLKHFKKKLGLPEQYQPGQPLPASIPEITQRVTGDILPFKVLMGDEDAPLSVSSEGRVSYPENFFYPLSFLYHYISNEDTRPREVDVLTDSEWTKRLSSQNEYPTKYYPVCNMQADHIRFMPKSLRFVDCTYLRLPIVPEYRVVYSSGHNVYDSVNSIQLEWDELNQMDIVSMLLSDLGYVVNSPDLFQLAEKIKSQGT